MKASALFRDYTIKQDELFGSMVDATNYLGKGQPHKIKELEAIALQLEKEIGTIGQDLIEKLTANEKELEELRSENQRLENELLESGWEQMGG